MHFILEEKWLVDIGIDFNRTFGSFHLFVCVFRLMRVCSCLLFGWLINFQDGPLVHTIEFALEICDVVSANFISQCEKEDTILSKWNQVSLIVNHLAFSSPT